jgi:preprotein translocase subunit YajC
MVLDPLTLVMLAVLAMLVFFMFRNGRKRKKDQETLQSTMVPGAEVMTNFGLYGTILSIDEEANKVALEIAPGTVVQIHRQTIARVVEPTVPFTDDADGSRDNSLTGSDDTLTGEPEFGQRLDENRLDENPDTDPKQGDK